MAHTFSDQDRITIRFSGAGVEVLAMTLEDLMDDYPEMVGAQDAITAKRDLLADSVEVTMMVAEWRLLKDQLYRDRYDSPIAERIESELAANGWVD